MIRVSQDFVSANHVTLAHLEGLLLAEFLMLFKVVVHVKPEKQRKIAKHSLTGFTRSVGRL